jgi:hypothetical protein
VDDISDHRRGPCSDLGLPTLWDVVPQLFGHHVEVTSEGISSERDTETPQPAPDCGSQRLKLLAGNTHHHGPRLGKDLIHNKPNDQTDTVVRSNARQMTETMRRQFLQLGA